MLRSAVPYFPTFARRPSLYLLIRRLVVITAALFLAAASGTGATEVDPRPLAAVPTLPAWSNESNQAVSFYGWDVNTAGDVNGDGYSDVLVGAKNFDHPQSDLPSHTIGNGGQVWLYQGTANGLSATASWTLKGDGVSDENGQVGFSCAAAGDVNGDGYDDVIISEPKRDTPGSPSGLEGRVLLFLGASTGLRTDTTWTFVGEPGSEAELGNCVGTAGDVNGDGYDDIIVSAQDMNINVPKQGRVYVFYGSASGPSVTPSWIKDGPLESGTWFGLSCHGIGDVNADGYDDIAIGALLMNTYTGRAWVYMGGPGGLSSTPAWTQDGAGPGSTFGYPVNRAGDVNGDGYADLIVGQTDFALNRAGTAFIYYGGAAGLSTSPAWQVSGTPGSVFGASAGTAGDVNGDGYSDIVVGAPDWVLDFDPFGSGISAPGHAYLYLGSASGPSLTPAWFMAGDDDSSTVGRSAASAGDVNGDGYGDFIVGAPGDKNGEELEGQAFLFMGQACPPSSNIAWSTESNQVGARQGSALAMAGDVNGDGYTDVVVGTPDYDNTFTDEGRATLYLGSASGVSASAAWTAYGGQTGSAFGSAVAAAGDVDGDGYIDVLIGAPGFSNGEAGEGRARMYRGGPNPPYLTFSWEAEGNQAMARFGASVASCGDVNGDGLADAIVGAPGYSNGEAGEGRAFVYTGWSGGLLASAYWTFESNAAGAGLGRSAAGAGDLNGDGLSDIIVGAPAFGSGQGRAFVFRGSSQGPEALPWLTINGAQPGDSLGACVGSAGDLDGDRFSDLFAASPGFSGSFAGEGRVDVWRGQAGGPVLFDSVTGGQIGARLGASAVAVPDLNGDGLGELLVGTPGYSNGQAGEGRIELYFGSGGGLAGTPDFALESNVAGAGLGTSVGSGGDVNADGFVDLVGGAPGYANGQAGEGRTIALFGNNGRGAARLPSQLRTLSSVPVAPLGRSDAADGFRLQTLGRTPNGRGKVRMEYEIVAGQAPFTGVPTGSTALTATGVPVPGVGSTVTLTSLATGLTPASTYRWRARFQSRSPFYPRSPWLSLSANGPSEPDLRTAGSPTGVGEGVVSDGAPKIQAWPNPFASRVTISFTMREAGPVEITIFDVSGRKIAEDRQVVAAGPQAYEWNPPSSLSRGVYFARVRGEGEKVVSVVRGE